MIVTVIQSVLGIHVPNLCFIVRYLIVACHSGIADNQLEGPVYYKHIFHLYSYSLISSIHEGQKGQLENLNGYSINVNRPLQCPYKWLHALCEKKRFLMYITSSEMHTQMLLETITPRKGLLTCIT